MNKSVILISQDNGYLEGMTSSGLGLTDIGKHPLSILGGNSKEFYHRVHLYYHQQDQHQQEEHCYWKDNTSNWCEKNNKWCGKSLLLFLNSWLLLLVHWIQQLPVTLLLSEPIISNIITVLTQGGRGYFQ
jgi:hypothetical protein